MLLFYLIKAPSYISKGLGIRKDKRDRQMSPAFLAPLAKWRVGDRFSTSTLHAFIISCFLFIEIQVISKE